MKRLRSIILLVVAMINTTAMAQKTLEEYVYWIDNDISASQSLGASGVTIDLGSLSKGIHTFTMRVKDNTGLWSSPVTKYFLVPRLKEAGVGIVRYMYWIDNDISASQSLGASGVTIDVGSLSKGVHTFTMRVKDNTGLWSSPVTKYFLVPRLKEAGVGIVRYMYWLDDDIDNGVVVETNGTNDLVNVEVGGLSEGKHTIYWRVGDSTGKWSQQVNSHLFNYVLPPTGIGALSSDMNLALHDNLQAGYCTEYDEELEHIFVEDMTTIPANTGVLLRGRGFEKVTLLEAEDNAVAEENQLAPVAERTLLFPSETVAGENLILIGSVDDWKSFASQVSSKPDLNAMMTADIDLGDEQTKIGTTNNPYKGTFDGKGHTLTVHLTGGDNIAPFVSLSNAQIKNLHVTGTVTVTGMRGAGIASFVAGNSTIENCHSSVVITTSRSGDYDGGGFVGRVDKGYNVTFTNCLFDGQLLHSGNAVGCGGFVGWSQNNTSASLENCFFNPSAPITIIEYDGNRTFVSGYSECTITNCYYTLMFVEEQGTDASGMGTSELASALGAGWEIKNDQVVPIMTVNSGDYTNFYLNDSRFLKVESMVIIPANRAYLRLPSSLVSDTKIVKLWWGNEEVSSIATSISETTRDKIQSEEWFTLEGMKLNGKPTEKGIYIRNGKKIIVK